ncbi:hypothetical protein PRUPE_2G145700 [Prunus persica]|uniref:DUF1499 domain-containing protein n=1 Tax=Prunus persica TaxID=3760 RepID=A0A251QFU7_PRUPE|nr:hypothetical protein PRUPE_2G145700 [Prunus persica]
MASMAYPTSSSYNYKNYNKAYRSFTTPHILVSQQQQRNDQKPSDPIGRREIILRSSELAVVGAIFNLRNYNGGRKKPVNREVAMEELLQVIKSTKPDKFTPRIMEIKNDYVRVEYEGPILGFVDDVEFWFPPGKDSLVEYRSASRLGSFDFDFNRKRIKALRQELEKKGWASKDSF